MRVVTDGRINHQLVRMRSAKNRRSRYGSELTCFGRTSGRVHICVSLLFQERGDKMMQEELNKENEEIKSKAYELYEKHGFKDGNDFVDWLEAEKQTRKLEAKRQTGKQSRFNRNKQMKNILLALFGILGVIVVILLITLITMFMKSPKIELSEKGLSELKVMMLVLDPKEDEKVVVFGDTHFDFGQSDLSQEAKTLLDADVEILKENSQM